VRNACAEVAKLTAERDAAVDYWKRIEIHHGKTEAEARGNKHGTLEEQIEYWQTRYFACSKLADAWEETSDAAVVQGLEIALEACKPWMVCKCDTAYTSRGRHESNAWHQLAEEIHEAIAAEIAKRKG